MEFKAFIFLVLLLFFQTRQIQSKRILCLLGVGTETAKKWNIILMNELSAKGHDLTVVTPVLWNAETERNIEFIHLENGMKFVQNQSETDTFVPNIMRQSSLMTILNWYDQQMATCRGNLNSRGLSEVLNMAIEEKPSFDMIMFDVTYGTGCLLPLADLFSGIPIIGITSSTLTSAVLSINQNSILNAAFDPFVLSGFDRNMNYWTRIYNTVLYGFDYIYYKWVVKPVLEGLWFYYTQDREMPIPETLNGLRKRFKVILANHHPTLHTLASLPYNVVPVPGLHIRTGSNATPSTDLSNFKETFINGVVLINLDLEQLGNFNVQTVLEVVRKLSKYGFIWKVDKNMKLIENQPKNLILETDLENQEILQLFKADNKIKFVFTTPDILSIQESLFHGIPIIALTLTADQSYLAQRIKEQGISVNLQLSDLSKLDSILESAFMNDALQNKTLQLQKSFVNQQTPSLDTAVCWVQHLLANPEANDYLYTASENSSDFFATTSLDIILFFEVLILLCVFNTIWVCKQTARNFRNFPEGKKISGKKNDSKIRKSKKEKKTKAKLS